MFEMPDPHQFDEARYEDSLRIHDEDRFAQDVFALYDMLRANEAYEIRTPEAELEREAILREIVELESLTAA